MNAIQVIDEPQMSPEMAARVRAALVSCFPRDAEHFARQRDWHGSAPAISIVATSESGDVVGHIGIHDRVVSVGDLRVRVAGVQNVCVVPDRRKTGLFDELMRATLRTAVERGYDAGLLFCRAPLEPIYARHGWVKLVDRPVWRHVDGQTVPLPSHAGAMFHPMRVVELPAGDLVLNGNDW
jgi:predicted N-acetyltransferase YhbS